MASHRVLALIVLSLVATMLAGCHTQLPQTFRFVAKDHVFEGPDEIPVGWVRIIMENHGPDMHHIQLFRLDDDRTVADAAGFFEEWGSEGFPPWLHPAGGPNVVIPGVEESVTVNVRSGQHVMVCLVPDNEGLPHAQQGMFKAIMATPAAGHGIEEPSEQLDLDLIDYSFLFPESPAAGTYVVEVENEGFEGHEATLFRIPQNRSKDDLIAAFGPNATGPPPGEPWGGVTGIAPAEKAYFEVTLDPGRYVFMCFYPEAETGAPHFVIGMATEFVVSDPTAPPPNRAGTDRPTLPTP